MSDTYLVIVETEDEEVRKRALSWERSYPLLEADSEEGPGVALLIMDTKRTSRDISERILGDDDEALCVVFDVGESPYSGRYYTALWEWLRKANGK